MDDRRTDDFETDRAEGDAAPAGSSEGSVDCPSNDSAVDDYDVRPVESAQELEELVRLRAGLSWSEWKAHPRFKRDRLLREGQRRFGVVPGVEGWRRG